MRYPSLVLVSLVVVACSSSADDPADPPDAGATENDGPKDQRIDATKECDRRIGCKQSTEVREDCILALEQLRVTSTCKALLDAATCETTRDQIDRTCFPACTSALPTACTPNDTVTTCSPKGYTVTYACEAVCGSVKRKTNNSCGVRDGGASPTCGCE